MKDTRAASRYVKSLLDLAVEHKVLDAVHDDMQLFRRTYKENRQFAVMLRSPVIKHDIKRIVLQKLFQGKVNNLTLTLFDIITRKNREPLLPAIAEEFHNAYNDYKDIGKAVVTTAVPMDEKLRNELVAIVKKLSERKDVELIETIDKDIIGGFVLDVGDKQIDASIKSRLKSLALEFSENPYVKEF